MVMLPQPQRAEYDRPGGCLLRLLWMAFGNLALLATAAGAWTCVHVASYLLKRLSC